VTLLEKLAVEGCAAVCAVSFTERVGDGRQPMLLSRLCPTISVVCVDAQSRTNIGRFRWVYPKASAAKAC